MIEQGIQRLVQSDPTVFSLCQRGGFLVELPADVASNGLPSWTYTTISDVPILALDGSRGYVTRRIQIDVYAGPIDSNSGPATAIRLGRAIDNVLHGFQGLLPDIDATYVSCCMRTDIRDFFNPDARNYRRMLEYQIEFNEYRIGSRLSLASLTDQQLASLTDPQLGSMTN